MSYVADPIVSHTSTNADPDAGQIIVQYPTALFDLAYDDIEDVLINAL